jgi:hypothetical protein
LDLNCLMEAAIEPTLEYLQETTHELPSREPTRIYTREEKISFSRSVCESLCSSSLRLNKDFPLFLAHALWSFLQLQGDKDMNIWTVTEECLNKLIQKYIHSSSEKILITLFKGIKHPTSIRSQRVALVKFSEVCDHIRPSNIRRFMITLKKLFPTILKDTNEALHESLSIAMERLTETLFHFLSETEVNEIITIFSANFSLESSSLRRSAIKSTVAVCRHYPKLRFDFVVSLLKKSLLPFNLVSDRKESPARDWTLNGVLFCLLQLVKASEDLGKRGVDPLNPMLHHLPFIGQLLND